MAEKKPYKASWEVSAPSSSTRWSVSPLPFVLMAHFLGLVSIVAVFFWTFHFRGGLGLKKAFQLFNVHPVLMVIGMILLPAEAILVYKTLPAPNLVKKVLHSGFHIVGLIVASFGIYAVFEFHRESHYPDMYSLHAWLGMSAIILFGLQWFIGLYTFVVSGLSYPAKTAVKPWHVFGGLFVFVLTIATAQLGLSEKLTFLEVAKVVTDFSREAILVNTIGLILLLLGGFVVLAAVIPSRE